MYWLGLIIISLVWGFGSVQLPGVFRYSIAFLIGLCYYVAFHEYA